MSKRTKKYFNIINKTNCYCCFPKERYSKHRRRKKVILKTKSAQMKQISASCFPFWRKQQEIIRNLGDLKSVGQIKARCQKWENRYNKLSDN